MRYTCGRNHHSNVKMCIQALYELLTIFPYHPILWSLYYTCRSFYAIKPTLREEKTVKEYFPVDDFWLKGYMGHVKDLLAIDDTDKKNFLWAYATMLEETWEDDFFANAPVAYIIPRDWLKHILIEDGYFLLLPVQFCCRPLIRRNKPCVVRCQSNYIDRRYFIDSTFFHIGIKECFSDIQALYAGIKIYLGLKQLNCVVRENAIQQFPLLLYILSECENSVIDFCDLTEHVKYKAKQVQMYLRHILVCKDCNNILLEFLQVSIDLVMNFAALEIVQQCYIEYAECDCEYVDKHSQCCVVECILDADYDELLEHAISKASCNNVRTFVSLCKEACIAKQAAEAEENGQ